MDSSEQVVDALNQAKDFVISDIGSNTVTKVMNEVLELEMNGPESFHNVQEIELVKAIFGTHAHATTKIFELFINMIQEGALVPDMEVINKMAADASCIFNINKDEDEEENEDEE